MKISQIQGLMILFLIGFSSILIFIFNNILNLTNSDLVNYLGSIVAITWLLSIFILSYKNINISLHFHFYGFLIVLGLFHLGIPLGVFFNYSNDYYDNTLSRWLYSEYTITAYIAVYFFLLGYLSSLFFPETKQNSSKNDLFNINDADIKVSLYLYIFLILIWIFLVKFVGGINNYSDYAEGNSNSSILSILFIYGNSLIGILYILISTNKEYSKKALYLLLFWAVFALPIGLRGEVIFPLVIGISFLVSQKIIKFNIIKISILTCLILTLLSAVFVYRHGQPVEGAEVNPFATLIEMGASLRPLSESVKWISNKDINLYYGETYWAPLERLLTKFIPFIERMPASQDMRLMNVVIFEKAGPYGYSIIAEAFVNFKILGCFIIGLISGCFLKFFDSREDKNNFLLLALVFSLFFHIRQSFVGAFGGFLIFLILCVLIKCLSNIFQGKRI